MSLDRIETLKFIRNMMRPTAIWPERNPPLNYTLRTYISMMFLFIFVVLTVVQAISNRNDVDEICFGLVSAIAMINCCNKFIVVVWNRERFFGILENLDDLGRFCDDRDLDRFIKRRVKTGETVFVVFIVSSVVLWIIVSFIPVINMKSGRSLAIAFPIDLDRSVIVFGVAWGFQVVISTITLLTTPAYDCLILVFMQIAVGHLEILEEKLVKMSVERWEFVEEPGVAIDRVLRNCVKHHVAIERYINSIESTYMLSFLHQLIASLLMTCIAGFNLVVVSLNGVEFERSTFTMLAAMLELIIFCVPGNEIIEHSSKIRDSCYMSRWSLYGPSVRKSLFLIMERSKRPFALTAGKFATLSLPTLLAILRSAVSYFTVLWQIYSRIEK